MPDGGGGGGGGESVADAGGRLRAELPGGVEDRRRLTGLLHASDAAHGQCRQHAPSCCGDGPRAGREPWSVSGMGARGGRGGSLPPGAPVYMDTYISPVLRLLSIAERRLR